VVVVVVGAASTVVGIFHGWYWLRCIRFGATTVI